MPDFNIVKKVQASKTFRVAAVMGKFDLQSRNIEERFVGNIDIEGKEWEIGVIVGASGTGKSSIAKELFPDDYVREFEYSALSVLDDFPESLAVEEITAAFNSVGFSSPPSWLKPYSVLSQGEQMRVNLARAILSSKDLIVFDEFTSVVDRNVAMVASKAISKAIRRGSKKLIVVSCHYDILGWLEPDWILDTNEMRFHWARGALQCPPIELRVYERKGLWELFRKYHYLNHEIHKCARQFVGFIGGVPVAFCGVLSFPHPRVKNFWRITRLVVMPDYQGIGIGGRMLNFVGDIYRAAGKRVIITTSTPALTHSLKSRGWVLTRVGRARRSMGVVKGSTSHNRLTTSWEYTG